MGFFSWNDKADSVSVGTNSTTSGLDGPVSCHKAQYLVVVEVPVKGLGGGADGMNKRKYKDLLVKIHKINKPDEYAKIVEERRQDVHELMQRLEAIGIKCKELISEDGMKLYIRLGVTETWCESEAELCRFQLKYHTGEKSFVRARYERFTKESKELFHVNEDGSLFTSGEKCGLILNVLKNELKTDKMQLAQYNISKIFPVHVESQQLGMLKDIFKCRVFAQFPVESVRQYYGERTALYFAYLEKYQKHIRHSALVGMLVALMWFPFMIMDLGTTLDMLIIAYSAFLILWAAHFLAKWRQYRHTQTYLWNTLNMKDEIEVRPEFKGKLKKQKDIDEMEVTYPMWRRLLLLYPTSYLVVGLMVAALFVVFVAMLAMKASKFAGPFTGFCSGMVTGVVVFVLNSVYKRVAIWMNNLENHKDIIEWENGYIIKTFLFQFVNSYATLYYIAFFKGKLHLLWGWLSHFDLPCLYDFCYYELSVQLISQFFAQILVGQTLEVGVPLIKYGIKLLFHRVEKEAKSTFNKDHAEQINGHIDDLARKSSRTSRLRVAPRSIEVESSLEEYDVFDDYTELVMQFGYVTLFAAANPLTPLLAWMNNLIEIRTDFMKTKFCRRPIPKKAHDIGNWYKCLQVISYISLITNCGIIVIYGRSDVIEKLAQGGHWWVRVFYFFCIEHAFLAIKRGIEIWVPVENARVSKELKRVEADRLRELQQRRLQGHKGDGPAEDDDEEDTRGAGRHYLNDVEGAGDMNHSDVEPDDATENDALLSK